MALQIPSAESIPNYLLPTWTDEVMSLFANDELIEGNPTVAGLRRVAEMLLGTIVSSKPTFISPVNGDGPGRATVGYTIAFHSPESPMGVVEYGDVADVWIGNSDPLFVGFAVSAAATRAEGRALRKAIKLKKVAAEELTKVDVVKAISVPVEGNITTDQINFIDTKCRKLNINVTKLAEKYGQTGSIYAITKEKATQIIKDLTTMTNKKDSIDPSIIGFEEWK